MGMVADWMVDGFLRIVDSIVSCSVLVLNWLVLFIFVLLVWIV